VLRALPVCGLDRTVSLRPGHLLDDRGACEGVADDPAHAEGGEPAVAGAVALGAGSGQADCGAAASAEAGNGGAVLREKAAFDVITASPWVASTPWVIHVVS
jgi:hypothetical protein